MIFSADRLLSDLFRIYRDARPQQERGEAFLESALAAALDERGVWGQIVRCFGFDLPVEDPTRITTQDSLENGRTDITLHWPGEIDLVLELKQRAPPTAEQVQRYLDAGKHVVVIAASPARYNHGFREGAGRYIGFTTWGRVRSLDWTDAPRAWRQLHSLVDTMGVSMSTVSITQLSAVLTSWPAWQVLDRWALAGAETAAQKLSDSKLTWVTKDRKRGNIFQKYEHYSRWFWANPWRAHGASPTGLCGFFVGRPKSPVLIEGIPDLVLAIRAKPDADLAVALRSDVKFGRARDGWLGKRDAYAIREALPPDSRWEFLRMRSSAVLLLQSKNPDTAFVDWVTVQAQDLVDTGVIGAIGDLELAARKSGTAPVSAGGPDDDEEHASGP